MSLTDLHTAFPDGGIAFPGPDLTPEDFPIAPKTKAILVVPGASVMVWGGGRFPLPLAFEGGWPEEAAADVPTFDRPVQFLCLESEGPLSLMALLRRAWEFIVENQIDAVYIVAAPQHASFWRRHGFELLPWPERCTWCVVPGWPAMVLRLLPAKILAESGWRLRHRYGIREAPRCP